MKLMRRQNEAVAPSMATCLTAPLPHFLLQCSSWQGLVGLDVLPRTPLRTMLPDESASLRGNGGFRLLMGRTPPTAAKLALMAAGSNKAPAVGPLSGIISHCLGHSEDAQVFLCKAPPSAPMTISASEGKGATGGGSRELHAEHRCGTSTAAAPAGGPGKMLCWRAAAARRQSRPADCESPAAGGCDCELADAVALD